ncbi:MAG: enoyl-CoA hydratase/isomerase family protein, partial [Bacillota bacterium]
MTLREPVLVERKGNVALVTLNRPEAMNAINTEMAQSLSRVFSELDSDDETRVIVLTGAGEKAFSAGADLKERIGLSLQGLEAQRRMLVRAFDAVGSARKPVIAAVNGYALGGGFELALLCDFIIAGDHAKLGLPEVKRGII